MAEVQTTPELETVPVTKTVDSKVVEDGTTPEAHEETNGVTNGIHTNGDAESTSTEVEVNNVAKVETSEANEVNGVEENGVVTNGDSEPEVVAAVAEEATADSATEVTPAEEPKEEVPPKVQLYQFPAGKQIPSTSPFCLKIETFLKINNIPYDNNPGYKVGKKGKLPWIEYNGEKIADSNFIIEYLKDKFDANLDSELTGEQSSVGRAVTRMLEENTYWALIFNRYVDNFNEYKKFLSQGAQAGILGFNVSQKMFQRKMRSNLDGHGMGKHSPTEVYKIAEDDLLALSTVLGEKEFLLGDKVSSYDCAVFGLCANILYSGMDNPMKTYITENATNVSDLCDRIKESYWSEWEERVGGEKPEPALKKGFSFRKKKTKAPKAEATAENGESAPAEESTAEAAAEEKPEGDAPSSDDAPTEEKPAENAEAPTEGTTAAETPAESTEQSTETKETTEPVTETTTEETTETKPDAEA